jgi:hypothetical protein
MRNVWQKTLVTVGIAVAVAVGPGVGMANAEPMVLPPITDLLGQLPELPEGALPAVPDLSPVFEGLQGLLGR